MTYYYIDYNLNKIWCIDGDLYRFIENHLCYPVYND